MSSPVRSPQDEKLRQLLLSGRRYHLNRQQILQSTEDRQVVNLIMSGFFRKYLITNDGTIGVQIIYGPGDIFPISILFNKMFNQPLYSGRETFFYEAMSKAEVRTIDVAQLAESAQKDPDLYIALLQESGRHLEFCINSLENVSLRNSGKRIAHMLCYFARKFGVSEKGKTKIDLPLTHQNIGEILNITRET